MPLVQSTCDPCASHRIERTLQLIGCLSSAFVSFIATSLLCHWSLSCGYDSPPAHLQDCIPQIQDPFSDIHALLPGVNYAHARLVAAASLLCTSELCVRLPRLQAAKLGHFCLAHSLLAAQASPHGKRTSCEPSSLFLDQLHCQSHRFATTNLTVPFVTVRRAVFLRPGGPLDRPGTRVDFSPLNCAIGTRRLRPKKVG
jgi:hypothetical protein